MEKNNILLEIEDRYCPICGKFIKYGSPIHRCLDEDIKKIEEERKESEEESEEERTYDDKLDEFDKFYNSDNYYNNDIEEE